MPTKRFADPTNTYVLEMEDRTDLFGDANALEPDPDWRFTDPEGHEHQWQFMNPKLAKGNPSGASPYLPSLRYVADDEKTGHHQCKRCRYPVTPQQRLRNSRVLWGEDRIYRLNGKEIDEELARAVFRVIEIMCDDSNRAPGGMKYVTLPDTGEVSHDTG